jgi:hypothetical protein
MGISMGWTIRYSGFSFPFLIPSPGFLEGYRRFGQPDSEVQMAAH